MMEIASDAEAATEAAAADTLAVAGAAAGGSPGIDLILTNVYVDDAVMRYLGARDLLVLACVCRALRTRVAQYLHHRGRRCHHQLLRDTAWYGVLHNAGFPLRLAPSWIDAIALARYHNVQPAEAEAKPGHVPLQMLFSQKRNYDGRWALHILAAGESRRVLFLSHLPLDKYRHMDSSELQRLAIDVRGVCPHKRAFCMAKAKCNGCTTTGVPCMRTAELTNESGHPVHIAKTCSDCVEAGRNLVKKDRNAKWTSVTPLCLRHKLMDYDLCTQCVANGVRRVKFPLAEVCRGAPVNYQRPGGHCFFRPLQVTDVADLTLVDSPLMKPNSDGDVSCDALVRQPPPTPADVAAEQAHNGGETGASRLTYRQAQALLLDLLRTTLLDMSWRRPCWLAEDIVRVCDDDLRCTRDVQEGLVCVAYAAVDWNALKRWPADAGTLDANLRRLLPPPPKANNDSDDDESDYSEDDDW